MLNTRETGRYDHGQTLALPGKVKHASTRFPNNRWSNIFLATTVVEALINMCLEAYVFYKYFGQLNLDNTTARTIPTYLAIYIFAFIFQIWLAILAVGKRNTIQVLALVVFNFAFLIYSAFQVKEAHNVIFGQNTDISKHGDVFNATSALRQAAIGHDAARTAFWTHLLPFFIAVPCVIGVAQVVYIACAVQLYRIFGWDIYQKLGASTLVKDYFRSYQVFVVLLTYDWFFFGGFVVQLLILFVDSSQWSFWVTVAALPVTILGLFAAAFAVRRELRWLLLVFDACTAAAMTYFGYEFWLIFGSKTASDYQNDRITLGIFAGVSLILLILTLTNSVVCQSYFGKADLWNKSRATEVDDGLLLDDMDHEYKPSQRVVLD